MQGLDLTLPSPEENLALDEALLDDCERGEAGEVLRFWEPKQFFVVVGYANSVQKEVNTAFCAQHGIRILRRCSGGGTVLQAPGCLDYSLVLRIDRDPALWSIPGTNQYVLDRHAGALSALLRKQVTREGHTDLALGSLKFSGNAQRRRKDALLFHGAFLLAMDFDVLEKALPLPSKQPEYRQGRAHRDFLMNLGASADRIKECLCEIWRVSEPASNVPVKETARLVREKYGRQEWIDKF